MGDLNMYADPALCFSILSLFTDGGMRSLSTFLLNFVFSPWQVCLPYKNSNNSINNSNTI